jgi:hypothetical protein
MSEALLDLVYESLVEHADPGQCRGVRRSQGRPRLRRTEALAQG